MCEILIKMSDNAEEDPRRDWRDGDVLCVREDGFVWGTEEVPPFAEVVQLIGVDPASIQQCVGEWKNSDGTRYRMSLWQWDRERRVLVRKSDGLVVK